MIVHHVVEGDPSLPALLLSGSLGTSLAMWAPQMPLLTEHFRVIRYDHRGHGDSLITAGPYSIRELGEDVVQLLDYLGVDDVAVCGLSIGGAVAMWLALHAPATIRTLVLACTRPSFPPPEQWTNRAGLVRSDGVASIADAVIDRWFTSMFRERQPETVASFRDMLESTPAEGYASCSEALASFDVGAQLGEIAVSCLVITGRDDVVAPPDVGEEMAAAIPRAQHVVLPYAAHLANVEQPSEFLKLTIGFLEEEFSR